MKHPSKDNKELLGSAEWSSPSNIAFIKYWGKKNNQIPANPSLSMTLNNAYTRTSVRAYKTGIGTGLTFKFYFENKKVFFFEKKIATFFAKIKKEMRFHENIEFEIRSVNSFPHSAGIASSASSMSALALCLLSIEEQLQQFKYDTNDFFRKASGLSRLGSGSACRSVYGGFNLWGDSPLVKNSSDEFAIPLEKIHPVFENLHDTILIVDSREKEVSSTAGHRLMNNHPFASMRFLQASNNLEGLLKCLETGNWEDFSKIVENEALTLHSMMLTSSPWFILLKPGTIDIIERIKKFRQKTSLPVTFTLDAGPNIHLIYPSEYFEKIQQFIHNELIIFCENRKFINDYTGHGPVKF